MYLPTSQETQVVPDVVAALHIYPQTLNLMAA